LTSFLFPLPAGRPDEFVKKITQNAAEPIFCQNQFITLAGPKIVGLLLYISISFPKKTITQEAKNRTIWDRCYDFKHFRQKIGVFYSKQSKILQNFDHNIGF
jgi:hypothetical protein